MPTRFYFPATEAADVTPSFSAAWTYNSEALRRRVAHVKGSSAITVGSQIGPWTSGQIALDRQYISDGMAAGIAFTSGSTNIALQLMVREYNNGDNTAFLYLVVRVISNDGSTVRATIRSITTPTALEFINNVSHRNHGHNINCDASYTTVAGDRLCIEIGYADNSGATPEASAKWGENATDLPVNNTQTTDGAGWIEFSNTITFSSPQEVLPGVGVLTLAGFSPTVFASDLKNVLPGVGALTLAGFAPSVTIGNNVLPGLGEISIEGFAPSVAITNNVNVSAGLGEITINGFSPSVVASDHKNVTPSNGELTLNGFAPSVELPVMVVTDKGELLLTGFEPSVTTGDNKEVTPGKGEMTLNGFSPSVNATDHKNILPGLGQLSFVGFEPVVETPVNINTELGQLILNGFEPSVQAGGGVEVIIGFGELILAGLSPTVTIGSNIVIPVIYLSSHVGQTVTVSSIIRDQELISRMNEAINLQSGISESINLNSEI